MPLYRDRLPMPPSEVTGQLGQWLFQLWGTINSMPRMSWFSGTTPNSAVTGRPGDLLVNVGSASTDSRLWIKGGAGNTFSTTGWIPLRTGPL